MQNQEFGRVPVVVEDTWNQEKDLQSRSSFVNGRLAELALLDHDELNFESDIALAA